MGRRTGRGRLSGIEQLPEEAGPIIAWAKNELRDRNRTQLDIYQEFFQRLEALKAENRGELEFTIPSFSAFNRHSIGLAVMSRRMDATREITGILAERWDAKSSDDLTVIASEAIKTLVFEMINAAGEAGFEPKEAKAMADALRSAAQAQGVSTARRAKSEASFKKGVEAAVDKVAKVKGLTTETAESIKAQILGVKS